MALSRWLTLPACGRIGADGKTNCIKVIHGGMNARAVPLGLGAGDGREKITSHQHRADDNYEQFEARTFHGMKFVIS